MERVKSIVGQKIVIYNQDKQILMLKRSEKSHGPWAWDLPGGGILLEESALECLEREVWEETWLKDISWVHPIHTCAKSYPDGTHIFYVGYTWRLDTAWEVILSDEHDEYLWIDPKDVDQHNLPEHRKEAVKKSMKG